MGGLIMVGKWYKFIGKKDQHFTPNKWYLCQEVEYGNLHFIDNSNDKEELNWFALENIERNIDLSNPMDYNPDEVKEEVKEPDLKIETITIVVINDEKYITNTVFDLKQLVKHLKEVTYRLDKQINEG
jgi:hypothetical protein